MRRPEEGWGLCCLEVEGLLFPVIGELAAASIPPSCVLNVLVMCR